MNILIADDDALSRLMLEVTLKRFGHAVVATEDGDSAWTALNREQFSVLITDYFMPGLDGFALTRLIRARHSAPYLYILLITSMSGKQSLLSAIEAGVDDFISKPFDPDLLAARLHVAERILGVREHVRQLEGLLPICAWCKKIQDDRGDWQRLEGYITQRSEARFTHGMCPECAATFPTDKGLA